jgi:hypothetical protein
MLPVRVLICMTIGIAVACAVARADDEAPIFEAAYERPFVEAFRRALDQRPAASNNALYFRVWKKGDGGGDVLSGHLLGATKDCWAREVHFCIHRGFMAFAAPAATAGSGWSWSLGDVRFDLVSKQQLRFRGRIIDSVTIKGFDTKFKSATYFVYNYEIGLIAFAKVRAENIVPDANGLPDILAGATILAGAAGLGGQENCRYWTCGKR